MYEKRRQLSPLYSADIHRMQQWIIICFLEASSPRNAKITATITDTSTYMQNVVRYHDIHSRSFQGMKSQDDCHHCIVLTCTCTCMQNQEKQVLTSKSNAPSTITGSNIVQMGICYAVTDVCDRRTRILYVRHRFFVSHSGCGLLIKGGCCD